MEVLTQTELRLRWKEIKKKIESGAVFIHPTDTIYGIGCDAKNRTAIEKIRKLKKRPKSPLSVWAPSIKWIKQNCDINDAENYLKHLPGPYTLILPLNTDNNIANNVSLNLKTLGVRIPKHWFSSFVQKLGFPIITTSVNVHGEEFMTDIDNLDPEIKQGIDFLIYDGRKEGRPSKIIKVDSNKVLER